MSNVSYYSDKDLVDGESENKGETAILTGYVPIGSESPRIKLKEDDVPDFLDYNGEKFFLCKTCHPDGKHGEKYGSNWHYWIMSKGEIEEMLGEE